MNNDPKQVILPDKVALWRLFLQSQAENGRHTARRSTHRTGIRNPRTEKNEKRRRLIAKASRKVNRKFTNKRKNRR